MSIKILEMTPVSPRANIAAAILPNRIEAMSQQIEALSAKKNEDNGLPYVESGLRIQATREALGYKEQKDFCSDINVQPNTYSQWESGKSRPMVDVASIICTRFGITLDWIYSGDISGVRADLAGPILERLTALSSGEAQLPSRKGRSGPPVRAASSQTLLPPESNVVPSEVLLQLREMLVSCHKSAEERLALIKKEISQGAASMYNERWIGDMGQIEREIDGLKHDMKDIKTAVARIEATVNQIKGAIDSAARPANGNNAEANANTTVKVGEDDKEGKSES